MPPSPESIIFRAIQNAADGPREPGARAPGPQAPGPVRSAEESTVLTNAVLSALHAAGYRIVHREGGSD